MQQLTLTIGVGIGATAFLDAFGIARKQLFGTKMPNYRLVGRWIGYMPRGRFLHESIAKTAPVRGEALVGWTAHYMIGIAFAALLVAIFGREWLERPTVVPALVVGCATVLAPYLLLQPGMGAGIAASKTPDPTAARIQSLLNHAIFGLGLYVSAMFLRLLGFH